MFAKHSPVQHCVLSTHGAFCGRHAGIVQRPPVQVRPPQQLPVVHVWPVVRHAAHAPPTQTLPLQHDEVPVPEHVAPTTPHVLALQVPALQRSPAQQSAVVTQDDPLAWHTQRWLAASQSM